MAITNDSLSEIYDKLPDFIKTCIDTQIQNAIDEQMELIQEKIKAQRPKIIAGVLLGVYKQMEMRTLEDRFVFEVKLQD